MGRQEEEEAGSSSREQDTVAEGRTQQQKETRGWRSQRSDRAGTVEWRSGTQMWKYMQMAVEHFWDQRLVWTTSRDMGGFKVFLSMCTTVVVLTTCYLLLGEFTTVLLLITCHLVPKCTYLNSNVYLLVPVPFSLVHWLVTLTLNIFQIKVGISLSDILCQILGLWSLILYGLFSCMFYTNQVGNAMDHIF